MSSYAYVDTSCLVALAFGERGAAAVRRRLEAYDRLYSANLLEAELRSAFAREGMAWEPEFIRAIGWVLPSARLTVELGRALEAGYLRGADLWHVACALHLHAAIGELDFLTLDIGQRQVAAKAELVTPAF